MQFIFFVPPNEELEGTLHAVAPQVVFEGKSFTTMFKTFTSPYHFTKRAGLGSTIWQHDNSTDKKNIWLSKKLP
jgi:hypothetical protein